MCISLLIIYKIVFFERLLLTEVKSYLIIYLALRESVQQETSGVWLSLARAPGLGPGGRRFESCHPDFKRITICGCSSMVEHQPSKLDTWVRATAF